MQRKTNKADVCAFVLLIGALFPASAQAYIDPGTGSYVLQIVIAGLAAGAFAIKLFWRKIKALFSGNTPPTDPNQESHE
jgi:hypothetical protein